MANQNLTETRPSDSVALPAHGQDAGTAVSPRAQRVKPLRYAVSLTDPAGKELFRKQFASSGEADGFAQATAELCPNYKVSSVDRIDGFAYELKGQTVTITASRRESDSMISQLQRPPV
jgi:hypothetical protein